MQTLETSPYVRFTRAIKIQATRKVYDNSMNIFMKFCNISDYGQLLNGSNEEIEDRIMNYIAAHLQAIGSSVPIR